MPALKFHSANSSTPYHRIVLAADETLVFDAQNTEYQALKVALAHCDPRYPIQIQVPNTSTIDFTQFSVFIDFLCTQNTAYPITITPLSTAQNTLLHEVYLYLSRKQEKSPILAHIKASNTPPTSKKIRRAKQLLNKGVQIQVQSQQQHHQHKEQSTQTVKEQQQQVQQQMAQTRENQIQQQQQRMQQLNQANTPVDISGLGPLIHEGNLDQLVTPTFSLEEAKSLWFDLVGQYATKVDDPKNRISHVPETTMRLIAQHREQFRDGIHFDDLPNGFGFTVREKEVDGKISHESILYYDKKLVESSDDKRQDSFLAARLSPTKPEQVFGTVGQFYPFLTETPFSEEKYQAFVKTNQAAFDALVTPQKKTSVDTRIKALLQLMQIDGSMPSTGQSAIQKQIQALITSAKTGEQQNLIHGLRSIFFDKGADGVTLFLNKLDALKKSGQYELFKRLFMVTQLDPADKPRDVENCDWRELVSTYSSRKDELSALEAMDYLSSMPPEQCNWWKSMSEQHAKTNTAPFNLVDLVNAHRHFFAQVKAIDPALKLPLGCPIENVRNMKTAYARILYVLQKALDPQEQARYLNKLDFGMQGVICGAARLGSYYFVSKEMDLTPESGILNWDKCKKYAPKLPKHNRKYMVLDTEYSISNPYFWDPKYSAQAHFHTPPFRTYPRSLLTHQKKSDYWYHRKFLSQDHLGYLIVVEIEAPGNPPPSLWGSHAPVRSSSQHITGGIGLIKFAGIMSAGFDYFNITLDGIKTPLGTIKQIDQEVGYTYEYVLESPVYEDTVYISHVAHSDPIPEKNICARIFHKRINDSILQDEAVMTKNNTLSYDIPLRHFIELTGKISNFSNLQKYFYRFVGTQAHTYPFTTYITLAEQLSSTQFDSNPKKNEIFQKKLLPLLALCCTGPRVLKQERDILADLNQLTLYLTSKPSDNQNIPIIDACAKKLAHYQTKPTLHEISALLLLSNLHLAGVVLEGLSEK
ncbi:MAG: hypothetical protein Q8R79_00925, partial [Legionellaceae bacterium]|nr:hypothetical protein [Legionellaceae bacterium]